MEQHETNRLIIQPIANLFPRLAPIGGTVQPARRRRQRDGTRRQCQRFAGVECDAIPGTGAAHPRAAAGLPRLAAIPADQPTRCRQRRHNVARRSFKTLHRISRSPRGTFAIDAERRVGRLRSQLDYASIDDLLSEGVSAFARELVRQYELLTRDIERAYFPRLPVPA